MQTSTTQTSLTVSRLGLGCMGMSEFYGESDPRAAQRVLEQALELGVTFFDTADMYGRGENERLIGGFVVANRDRVVIATKCGIVRGATPADQRRDTSPAYIRSACEASLRRLGVESIDLFYLHRLDEVTPVEDSIGELSRLVEEGKVRHLGLSEVTLEELCRANAVHAIAAVQSEYSLSTRGPDVEAMIDACAALGALFVPFSPLGRGLLTAAYRSAEDFKGADFRTILPRFQPGALEQNLSVVDRLAELASAKGCTVAQLALAWVLARGPHVVPIPGTRQLHRLAENVGAVDLSLSADDLAAIERAAPADAIVGDRYPVSIPISKA
ncbi:MAG: aldo/keto reductase [Pseudomonadota bacterium]|uniref:aldo/keto reductase n=1 Tax=Phenylobacterium sp. TaxID=1871053 RepID=UPI0025ED7418|nr:aldo/keto reductase [Phenylobacterium sp.]MBT9471679.1 aldo/keto reductase [Phenylobacterium sp.]